MSEGEKKVLEKVFSIFERKPETFDGFAFVDGLHASIRSVCAQRTVDGVLRWCCWKCGGLDGLFAIDTAVDVPKNNQGAWVRLHKKCA